MRKIFQNIDLLITTMLCWCVVCFLIILFEEPIGALARYWLVFRNFDNKIIKTLFLLVNILICCLLIKKVRIFNLSLFLNSICVCIVYSLFRFHVIEHATWDFATFDGNIQYMDAVWMLPIISIIPCIAKFIEKLKDNHNDNSYIRQSLLEISDNHAIELESDDLFGYAEDAENFLKILEKNKISTEKGAVIVGLKGGWGKGKTSYLNLMRNYADTQRHIILIRINVWQSHSYKDMAKKLLSAIANGIGDISLKNLINDYSKAIIDADISILSKLVRLVSIWQPRQPEELFDIVGEKIKELNKCLIVQIDDIDRLTGEEILYTLKFIRNIACFRNTFFIVAYDEEYLKKQFCELQIENSYLEKIFNVVYPLPAVRKEEYIDIVKKELKTSLMIDADVEKVIDEFMEVIDGNISLRNAKRLASSIQCGLSMLKDEDGDIMIDLLDYILVQYLQLINARAYDFLSTFKDNSWITDKCIVLRSPVYIINREGKFGSTDKLSDEEYKKNRLSQDVGKENLELTYRIFQKMFDQDRETVLGIAYVNSFPLYFKRVFDKKLIQKKEFYKSAKMRNEAFSKAIKLWYDKYDRFTLNSLITTYDRCDTEDEWLHFLKSIMEITPSSYLDFDNNNMGNGAFIPTPGLGVIKEKNREAVDVLYEAIASFFFDNKILESGSLEILQKKFVLLIHNWQYYNRAYRQNSQCLERDIFELYWNTYWAKINSYNDFNEDFWYFINENFHFQDKLDMREVATNHIKAHIDNFMENYPMNNMSNYYALQTLFTKYIIDGNSAYIGDEWQENFMRFLNSVEPKSEALLSYIDSFEKYLDTTNERTTTI